MQKQRTIFIWDVHWCYKELKLLLKKINLQENDKVYLVWDLICKWPKGYKVLKFLYKNKEQFKYVLWNYEMIFLDWLNWKPCEYNIKDFEILKEKLEKHDEILEYLKKSPLYIEEENFILIHWWLIPWKNIKDHKIEEITKLRDYMWKPWYEYYSWDKKIIYWHRGTEWIKISKKTIWLDSWCVYWKWLTAYILETWEIISQSALDTYVNVYKRKIMKNETIWTEEL
jgi:hypothetical protein